MQKNCENRDGYIAVEGMGAALELVQTLLKVNRRMQVLVEEDDCGIYIVSWAAPFDSESDAFRMVPGQLISYVDELIGHSAKMDWKEFESFAEKLWARYVAENPADKE